MSYPQIISIDYDNNPTTAVGVTMPTMPAVTREAGNLLPPDSNDIARRTQATLHLSLMVWLNLETNIHHQWCVPWNLLHHKTLKTICGVGTGAKAHAQYLFRLFNPGADTDTHESQTLIHDFIRITNEISNDIKKDTKNYVQLTIYRLFTTSCIYLGLLPRPEVSNFANAIKSYVPSCLKACQIMKYAIQHVKDAFKFDNNKNTLVHFLMEHRNMCIIPREPTPVYTFPIRLVHSVCDDISSTFNQKFGAVLQPHCKWEVVFLRSRGIIRKIQSPSSNRRVLPRSTFNARVIHRTSLNQSPATSTPVKQETPISDIAASAASLGLSASSGFLFTPPSFPPPNEVSPPTTSTPPPVAAAEVAAAAFAETKVAAAQKVPDAAVAAQILAAKAAAAADHEAKVAAVHKVAAEQEAAAAAQILLAATEKKTIDDANKASAEQAVCDRKAQEADLLEKTILAEELAAAQKAAAEKEKKDEATAAKKEAAAQKAAAEKKKKGEATAAKKEAAAQKAAAEKKTKVDAAKALLVKTKSEEELAATEKAAAEKKIVDDATAVRLAAAPKKKVATKKKTKEASKAQSNPSTTTPPPASYCSNQDNHPDKICNYSDLKLKAKGDLVFYGITGSSRWSSVSGICGNPGNSCMLRNKEASTAAFLQTKVPSLYVCEYCITVANPTEEKLDYTPPFFLCKTCYHDVTLKKHPKLDAPKSTRRGGR